MYYQQNGLLQATQMNFARITLITLINKHMKVIEE